jgi:hypothetical protein
MTKYSTGTFKTPLESGVVAVGGLGFKPDVLLFTATNAASFHRTDSWTYGKAVRLDDGSLTQNVVSVTTDAGSSERTGGSVRTGQVLDLMVHDDDYLTGLAGSVEAVTDDGFEVVLDASALPDGTGVENYTVAYQVFATPENVEAVIGHAVTPVESGIQEISLGIDANYLALTATDATGEIESATVGADPVAICHGTAVGDGTTQQVQTGTVDPGDTLTGAFGAHTDRALHLLDVEDGAIAGCTSARVTDLGETLELTYNEIAPAGDSKGRTDRTGQLITFVALAAGDEAPEIGTIEFPAAEAGGEQSVSLGRMSGLVTFTTSPATAGTDRVLTGSGLGFGWSHGIALRIGGDGVAQSVLQRAVDDDLVARYARLLTGEADPGDGGGAGDPSGGSAGSTGGKSPGATDGGAPRGGDSPPTPTDGADTGAPAGEEPAPPQLPPAVAAASALDLEGTVVGWDALAVTSFDDRGFTLAAASVSSPTRDPVDERPLVCYTAWPMMEDGS